MPNGILFWFEHLQCVSFDAYLCKVIFVGESVKNTLSEALKVTIAVSVALNHLNLVVTAFGKAVGVGNIK